MKQLRGKKESIKNLDECHSKKAFQEEYDEFILKYGFERHKYSLFLRLKLQAIQKAIQDAIISKYAI